MFQSPPIANRETVSTNCRGQLFLRQVVVRKDIDKAYNKKMKKTSIKYFLFLFVIGMAFSCQKRDTQVTYEVFITKLVDSLPCQANIEYPDLGKKKSVQVTNDWNFSQKINHDQYVVLTASAVNNIKTLTVKISAKGTPASDNCSGNCTVSVRKNLYD